MEKSTIALRDSAGFIAGENVIVSYFDMRRWKRVLHFITFRRPPMKQEIYKITSVNDGNTLTIEE